MLSLRHAQLSSCIHPWWMLVLHGQFVGSPQQAAGRMHRCIETCDGKNPLSVSILDRCLRDSAIHAVWTLPAHDADFSTRWRLIKTHFSRSLPRGEQIDEVRESGRERGIWQRRFWEHMIRDEADYARHVEYCYINPVKHGLVLRVQDWPYSSFHRDVRAGIFPIDWAGDVNINGGFGEVR